MLILANILLVFFILVVLTMGGLLLDIKDILEDIQYTLDEYNEK